MFLKQSQSIDHAARIAHFALGAVRAANETPIDIDNPYLGNVQIRVSMFQGHSNLTSIMHA